MKLIPHRETFFRLGTTTFGVSCVACRVSRVVCLYHQYYNREYVILIIINLRMIHILVYNKYDYLQYRKQVYLFDKIIEFSRQICA